MSQLFLIQVKYNLAKKITLSVLFLAISVFYLPQLALGAIMELTVDITNVKIPSRAVAAMATDRPDTEFKFGGGRIVVVEHSGNSGDINNSSGYIRARGNLKKSGVNAGVQAQTSATLYFLYDDTRAPYYIYVESSVISVATGDGSNQQICRSDCSNVIDNPGSWYFTYVTYWNSSSWIAAYCPNSCQERYNDQIGFDPQNIILDPADNAHYWRSPDIFVIN